MPAEGVAKQKIIDKLQTLHRVLPPREETKRRSERFFDSCKWLYVISPLPDLFSCGTLNTSVRTFFVKPNSLRPTKQRSTSRASATLYLPTNWPPS